jgi:hypothetical protein
MGAYLMFWAGAVGVALAVIAVLVVHGGWQAGAAGIAVLAGTVSLTALIALGVEGDRTRW